MLRLGGGRVAYWIEIEPRAYDHFRSLVFSTTGAMPIEVVVRRLLEVAAERAGVWPDSTTLQQLVAAGGMSGIGACAVWRHLRLDPLKPETDGLEGLGPLSADAALTEIRKVLSR